MNDYIVRLREKYNDYLGCTPGIVLDCRDFWRHCVTAPEMAMFGYRLESSRCSHHVVVTAGTSQTRMHFVSYMGSAHWSNELICYLDVLGDEDLRHLQWFAGLPFHECLTFGHGYSVTFGSPLYEHSLLRHLLLLSIPLGEDTTLFDGFDLSAHSANSLWVVLLTEQEYQVKVNRHLEGIAEVLSNTGHPLSLDRYRHRYVTGQRPEGLRQILYQATGQPEQKARRQALLLSGKSAMTSFNRFDAVLPVCRSARRLRFLPDMRTVSEGHVRKPWHNC